MVKGCHLMWPRFLSYVLFSLCVGVYSSTTWLVDQNSSAANDTLCRPCSTLVGAWGHTNSDDEIQIKLGTYYITTPLQASYSLTVKGEPGVILMCSNIGGVGFVVQAPGFSLDGVTMQSCTNAVTSNANNTQITNCNFTLNDVSVSVQGEGAGITGFVMKDCVVSYSIMVQNSSAPVTITAAVAPQITSVTFSGNYAQAKSTVYGRGLLLWNTTNALVSNCLFDGNTGAWGSALVLAGNCTGAVLEYLTFTNNTSSDGAPTMGLTIAEALTTASLSHSIFIGNSGLPRADGGAIYIDYQASLTIDNCTFDSNQAAKGGAIYTTSVSPLIIKNSKFINNTGTSGSPDVQTDGPLSIQNCTFDSSSVPMSYSAVNASGAIVTISQSKFRNLSRSIGVLHGNLTVTYCDFINNPDVAISVEFAVVVINGSNFIGNSRSVAVDQAVSFDMVDCLVSDSKYTVTQAFAPVTIVSCAAPKLTNVTFQHTRVIVNQYYYYASALLVESSSNVVLFKCSFFDNEGPSCSTIVFRGSSGIGMDLVELSSNFGHATIGIAVITPVPASMVTITNSRFFNNSAQDGFSAAAMSVESGANANITNCTFDSNNAGGIGGALIINSVLTLTSSTFTNNSAGLMGGAIYLDTQTASAIISNCSFDSNSADHGAAIYIATGSAHSISNSTFSNNTARGNGGAIFVTYPTVLFNANSTFLQNSALGGAGGAIFTNSSAECQNVIFKQNSAIYGGALAASTQAASVSGVSLTLSGVNSAGNSATFGGALYILNLGYTVTNSYLLNNTADKGAGLFSSNIPNSRGQITNTIFSYNHANTSGGGIYLDTPINIATGEIVNNSAPVGDGIYIAQEAAERNLKVQNTRLTNLSPFVFCCGDVAKNNPIQELCNYPSCSLGCGSSNTSSCECDLTPSPPCSCSAEMMGDFCNIPNACPKSNCSGGCGYDIHYNMTCCDSGFYLFNNNSCNDVNECSLPANHTCDPNAQCFNDVPGYHCECNPPLIMNGTNCTACTGIICYQNLQCQTIGLNFSCGSCPDGYGGSGIGVDGCKDIDECTVHPNGNCDMHTMCTNEIGSYQCSDCPAFYVGSGKNVCTPLCGDNFCNSSIGEQCVLCPLDCPSPCGQCGDHVCSPGETCKTCSEDCGPCKVVKCPSDCSHHGTCNGGICACTGDWGGPSCNIANSNYSLNISSSDPGFNITTNQITFSISFKEIKELDQSENVVSSFNLTNKNYTFTLFNKTTDYSANNTVEACSNCDLSFYVHTSGGSNNKQYSTNFTLENRAYIEFMIWDLEDATTFTFANATANFPAKTIKLAIQIKNWPFKTVRNSLALVLDSISSNSLESCVRRVADENNNLKWVTINVGGVSLYSQFMDSLILDGTLRQVNFQLEADNSITAIVPHFWVNAVLDPAFSVLLEPSSCHNDNKHLTKILEIVVPIVFVFIVLLVVFIIFFPKIKSYLKTKHSARVLSKERVPETMTDENGIEIEPLPKYDVHTTAGHFQFNPNA